MQRRSRNLPHQAGLLTAVDLISDCFASCFAMLCFASLATCHTIARLDAMRSLLAYVCSQQVTPADCEDSYGRAVLLERRGVVKGYKQPKDLLSVSDVPMRVITPSASRALTGRLFAGHPSLRWLCACFVAVHELRVSKKAPLVL